MHEHHRTDEEQLRDLASHFRKIAAETHWSEYVRLFEATAAELDRLAAEAEQQEGGRLYSLTPRGKRAGGG